jgi:hypothetical protein
MCNGIVQEYLTEVLDGDGMVSLPDVYTQAELRLPPSVKPVNDSESDTNSVYLVAGFHQLHCLVCSYH